MARTKRPLLSLRASGKLGGHRRGRLAPDKLVRVNHATADARIFGAPVAFQPVPFGNDPTHQARVTYVGGGKASWIRSILRFDLSSFIGMDFSTVILSHWLDYTDTASTTCFVSALTDPADWLESEVTWLERSSGNPWANPGGDLNPPGAPDPFEITCKQGDYLHGHPGFSYLVAYALMYEAGILSFLLSLDQEDPGTNYGSTWASREHSTKPAPYLTLIP